MRHEGIRNRGACLHLLVPQFSRHFKVEETWSRQNVWVNSGKPMAFVCQELQHCTLARDAARTDYVAGCADLEWTPSAL